MGKKKANPVDQMAQQYPVTMGNRSSGEYDFRTSNRQYVSDQYRKLYEGVGVDDGSGGGGGGGGGAPAWVDPATGMRQSVYDQYADLAKTGGWTDPEMANYRSWTTAPIAGFYQGMKRDLSRHNAAVGGYAGYNSQAAKLNRDAARQGFLTAQESESGLQEMIRSAKERGLAGMASEAEAISAASRPQGGGGGGGGGGGDDDAAKKDYYLRQIAGLSDKAEDIPYAQLQGQGINTAMGNQAQKTDAKMKKIGTAASVVGTVAAIAIA